MFLAPVTRALACSAALFIVAGCAGGSAPPVSPGQSIQTSSVKEGAVQGNLPNGDPGYLPAVLPAKTLYVADFGSNVINIYDATQKDPKPVGRITQGINKPEQIATDNNGTLYVANLGNNTVTEYLHNQIKPDFTISRFEPLGIAVDSKGNVFVSTVNNLSVLAYHPRSHVPYEFIQPQGDGVSQISSLAEDSHDTLYLAVNCCSEVVWAFTVPNGSTTAKALPFPDNQFNNGTGVGPSTGITIGLNNTLYATGNGVTNRNRRIYVYKAGQYSSPWYSINAGNPDTHSPGYNGIVQGQLFFQSDITSNLVYGYAQQNTTPFSTISGNVHPTGIAGFPKQTL